MCVCAFVYFPLFDGLDCAGGWKEMKEKSLQYVCVCFPHLESDRIDVPLSFPFCIRGVEKKNIRGIERGKKQEKIIKATTMLLLSIY